MIAIYQIRLHGGLASASAINAKSDMMFGANNWKDDYKQYYTRVYEVDTDDLEEAFKSTNLWEDNKVTRLVNGSSSSVGDIFVKDGDCYIVDNFGFANVGKYELGA